MRKASHYLQLSDGHAGYHRGLFLSRKSRVAFHHWPHADAFKYVKTTCDDRFPPQVLNRYDLISHSYSLLITSTDTLKVVQSRGVPFLLVFWSIFDYVLLSGRNKLSSHWLFYQDFLDIFNEQNPRYAQDGWWLPNMFSTVCIRLLLTLSLSSPFSQWRGPSKRVEFPDPRDCIQRRTCSGGEALVDGFLVGQEGFW
jgi:hypothetical protein